MGRKSHAGGEFLVSVRDAETPTRIDRKKQPAALNLRSHSLDKLRQIITTGASSAQAVDVVGQVVQKIQARRLRPPAAAACCGGQHANI
eukprot:SAG25_NODE_5284_length_677_cov_4.273356_1_plen_88_part_01